MGITENGAEYFISVGPDKDDYMRSVFGNPEPPYFTVEGDFIYTTYRSSFESADGTPCRVNIRTRAVEMPYAASFK
jgi:hypothetical protein